jgi:hypothetical protein
MAGAGGEITMREPVVTPVDRKEHLTIAGMRIPLGDMRGRGLRSLTIEWRGLHTGASTQMPAALHPCL